MRECARSARAPRRTRRAQIAVCRGRRCETQKSPGPECGGRAPDAVAAAALERFPEQVRKGVAEHFPGKPALAVLHLRRVQRRNEREHTHCITVHAALRAERLQVREQRPGVQSASGRIVRHRGLDRAAGLRVIKSGGHGRGIGRDRRFWIRPARKYSAYVRPLHQPLTPPRAMPSTNCFCMKQ